MAEYKLPHYSINQFSFQKRYLFISIAPAFAASTLKHPFYRLDPDVQSKAQNPSGRMLQCVPGVTIMPPSRTLLPMRDHVQPKQPLDWVSEAIERSRKRLVFGIPNPSGWLAHPAVVLWDPVQTPGQEKSFAVPLQKVSIRTVYVEPLNLSDTKLPRLHHYL